MAMLRLSSIANFMGAEHDLMEVAQHLALKACPTGQICRVYIAQIKPDLKVMHLASFGYEKEFIDSHLEFTLHSDPLIAKALQSDSITIRQRDQSYLQEMSEQCSCKLNDSETWKSTVFLPMLPNFFVAMSFQTQVDDIQENRSFFELLRSIISMYLQLSIWSSNKSRSGVHRKLEAALGDKLTARQEDILELIKQGFTNLSIANQIGYSESLIRQETILIYQKLGISGRRDLIHKVDISPN